MKRHGLWFLLTLSLLACFSGDAVRAAVANGTAVAVPGGGAREIQTLTVGDRVQVVSSYTRAEGRLKLEWASVPVSFSSGTNGGEQPTMVYITYAGGTRKLIVTPDQPLMRADGTITKAAELHAGDLLATADAGAATAVASAVNQVSLGHHNGGVHHISVGSTAHPASPAGHLIVMEGVIAGDYAVQMYFPTMSRQ
jgi:hypothetical protein